MARGVDEKKEEVAWRCLVVAVCLGGRRCSGFWPVKGTVLVGSY